MRRIDELEHRLARVLAGVGPRPVLVALDGRSGVGKTTVAAELAARHAGAVITADDFFAGGDDATWRALTPAQRADGVIDWQRLRTEALQPLLEGQIAHWRTFGWERGHGLSDDVVIQEPAPLLVLDGAYSARPELADLVDLTVLMSLDDTTRRARLLAREGPEFMRGWHALWDEAEDHYFHTVRPPATFDLVLAMD